MISSEAKNKLLSSLGIGNASDLDFLLNKFGSEISSGGASTKGQLDGKTPFHRLVEDIRTQVREKSKYKQVFEETLDFKKRWNHVTKFIKAELPPCPAESPKSSDLKEKVESLKTEGNEHFSRKRFKEAVKSYTAGIRLAAESFSDCKGVMSLLLGNRSAAFYQLKDYKTSLEDIKGAIYFEYPAELIHKLIDRRARCRYALDDPISEIKSEITASSPNNESLLQTFDDFVSSASRPSSKKTKSKGIESLLDFPRHERVPQLAQYVDIIYSETLGRHGIALRDISPGEPILYERPCVFHLNPSYSSKHCYDCGASLMQKERLLGVYPHLSDKSSAFCSWPCFDHWVMTSYPYEKKYNINTLFGGGTSAEDTRSSGAVNLAYEVFLRHSYNYFKNNVDKEFEAVDPRFGSSSSGRKKKLYLSKDVGTMYDLEGHRNKRKDDEESLTLLVHTWILLQCLEKVHYFPPPKSGDRLWIGELIHHFLTGIKYNLHSVDRVRGEMSKVQARGPIAFESIGSGIFPTLLLLNHSCATNTIRLNLHGSAVLVVAKTFIPAGHEVSDCYGPHHLSSNKEERLEDLSHGYNFACGCLACSKGDSIFPLLKNCPSAFRGQNEGAWDKYLREFGGKDSWGSAFESLRGYLSSFSSSSMVGVPDRNLEKGGIGLSILLWTSVNGNQ